MAPHNVATKYLYYQDLPSSQRIPQAVFRDVLVMRASFRRRRESARGAGVGIGENCLVRLALSSVALPELQPLVASITYSHPSIAASRNADRIVESAARAKLSDGAKPRALLRCTERRCVIVGVRSPANACGERRR